MNFGRCVHFLPRRSYQGDKSKGSFKEINLSEEDGELDDDGDDTEDDFEPSDDDDEE
ncbi:MAG: hypothetical protein OK457_08915 [Thaumarchaeota archaeon]|nr:hypothetical protein [Nitrososphaerota archaeon]